MKIIETDNFGGDYPDEKFLSLPPMTKEAAEMVADAINRVCSGPDRPRFWRVVENDYTLQLGFEP